MYIFHGKLEAQSLEINFKKIFQRLIKRSKLLEDNQSMNCRVRSCNDCREHKEGLCDFSST